LLVDGYNIIYAWPDLRELAADNMDGARMKLLDVLCNYQGIRQCRIIVVFDAYRIQGHEEETISYHNIQIVYTREAQTADQYIERFAHKNSGKYRIAVATSDGLQQIIIRGAGCALLSASELKEEIAAAEERLRGKYENQPGAGKNRLMDLLSLEQQQQVEELRRRSE
jgi:predicted RNA-binding protein with PIN domain